MTYGLNHGSCFLGFRFEEDLDGLAKSIHLKGGTKKTNKVHQRLGRIKERYPAVNKHYKIVVEDNGQIATWVTYSRNTQPTGTKQTTGRVLFTYLLKRKRRKSDMGHL